MEQTSSSTTTSTTSSSSTAPNQPDHHHYNTTYLNLNLRQLNKSSHRISKPIIRRAPPPPPPPPPPQQEDFQQNQPQPQPQPPVYNINKSDFRQVVQKLTGSPAHDHLSTTPPPPPPPPKPQPSRLHRIRPPPLAHLITGPPPPHFQSTISPLSPLPPFPTVHAAAESPISAYMKYLRGTSEWFNPNLMPPPPPAPAMGSGSGSSQFVMPASPRSPYPLLSPSAQLGFQQFRS